MGNSRTCSIQTEGNMIAGVKTNAVSGFSGAMLEHLSQIFNRGTFVGRNGQSLLERFVVAPPHDKRQSILVQSAAPLAIAEPAVSDVWGVVS